jgi:hypothetical protein
LSYPDINTPEVLLPHVLTVTAVKEFPSQANWPPEVQYVFNPKDPRTGYTLFVNSYESHARRTPKKAIKILAGLSYDPKEQDEATKKEKFIPPPRKVDLISSNFKNVFDVIMGDQAHKLKNLQPDRWRYIFEMNGTFHLPRNRITMHQH